MSELSVESNNSEVDTKAIPGQLAKALGASASGGLVQDKAGHPYVLKQVSTKTLYGFANALGVDVQSLSDRSLNFAALPPDAEGLQDADYGIVDPELTDVFGIVSCDPLNAQPTAEFVGQADVDVQKLLMARVAEYEHFIG